MINGKRPRHQTDGRLTVGSAHLLRSMEAERVLTEAEAVAGGDRERALAWFLTERLADFDNLTSSQLVQEGKAQVVVDYIRSIAGGPTG